MSAIESSPPGDKPGEELPPPVRRDLPTQSLRSAPLDSRVKKDLPDRVLLGLTTKEWIVVVLGTIVIPIVVGLWWVARVKR